MSRCGKNDKQSNMKATYGHPVECYGFADDGSPTCEYLDACRGENGLKIWGGPRVKSPKGTKEVYCRDCREFDSCLKKHGPDGIKWACKFFKIAD